MALDSGSQPPKRGNGRRKGRRTPKGRQVDLAALDEVRALLAGASLDRDLLIEHLHRLQDSQGHLSARHLAALAELMRLPMAEVYEIATFYAHFDVVKEGETPPPAVTVRVCDSLTCQMNGAARLLETLPDRLGAAARVVRAPCMGRCAAAPVAEVGHQHLDHASQGSVASAVADHRHHPDIPPYTDFAAYEAQGGYGLLRACLNGQHTVDQINDVLDESGLRGMGGAGFPTGRKWRFVRAEPGPRLVAINGDEGEPGTFKDRYFLETDPHRVLEGMLISAWAVKADAAYIYMRDEYPAILEILRREIGKLVEAGLAPKDGIHLRRGAGAYICGEETAMLESLEGKRGLPRHRPPYAAQVGLFGRPTLINNIETVYWIRDIVEKGADWFASQGVNGAKGLRAYSVSGRVREPGVKIVSAGITLQDLIDTHCGGMADGHTFKAYLPGGASGGILPATMADIPLDFGQLEKYGCFVGSGAVIVLSDKDNLGAAALNLMRFFQDESCGQCTPCRVGTEKVVKLMEAESWDEDLLKELANVMKEASICGLGYAAINPFVSVLNHFRDDVTFRKADP